MNFPNNKNVQGYSYDKISILWGFGVKCKGWDNSIKTSIEIHYSG